MNCIAPPPLDDAQLLAYLDHAATPEVARHVADCAFCRRRAVLLAGMERRLATGLYRATCPSPDELGEYHLGLQSGGAARAIAAHVARCPACAREMAQLDRFLGELAPEREPTALQRIGEGLRVLVAHLVDPGWGTEVQLAMATVRGGTAGPMTFEAGEVQISLDVQESAEAPGARTLLGLVSGLPAGEAELDVWQEGDLVLTAPVDALGNFLTANLPGGQYDLVLRAPGLEVQVPDLHV